MPSYVLVLDDDASTRALVADVLGAAGFSVRAISDAHVALAIIALSPPGLVVLDLEMPRMSGREFFQALRASGHRTPVLILSGKGALAAMRELGAQGAIKKPFDIDELVRETSALIDQAA